MTSMRRGMSLAGFTPNDREPAARSDGGNHRQAGLVPEIASRVAPHGARLRRHARRSAGKPANGQDVGDPIRIEHAPRRQGRAIERLAQPAREGMRVRPERPRFGGGRFQHRIGRARQKICASAESSASIIKMRPVQQRSRGYAHRPVAPDRRYLVAVRARFTIFRDES